MASAGDFWARIVGSLYFIPLFLGVIAGFPYAVFAGGIAIIWLAYEAARMLTGKQHTLRMALIWLLLVLPFFLAFAPLSSVAIALLWFSLFGISFFLNKQKLKRSLPHQTRNVSWQDIKQFTKCGGGLHALPVSV